MKVLMIFAGSGPLVVLTSHGSVTDPSLLEKLRAKGIDKFIACEISIELAERRYGGHFQAVKRDLRETDDLRVLDFNGERAFRLFRLSELGGPDHARGPRRSPDSITFGGITETLLLGPQSSTAEQPIVLGFERGTRCHRDQESGSRGIRDVAEA